MSMGYQLTEEEMRAKEEADRRIRKIYPYEKRGVYLRDAAKRLAAGTNVTYQAALDGLYGLCELAARSIIEQEIMDRKSGDEGEVSDGD